jgi:DNA-binding winged helix-turn-helix (wHTH) protein/Tol biopolymer transport system component
MDEVGPVTNATPPPKTSRSVRFGSFEVDLRTGELRKGGLKVKLHGQPFEVLAILLERPGDVVTREELQHKLWASDTFVDFEHGLNKAINKLREALGDSPDNPRFIETLPRRGYRFIGAVLPTEGAARQTEAITGMPPSMHSDITRHTLAILIDAVMEQHRARRRWLLAAAGLGLMALSAPMLVLKSPQPPKVMRYAQITKDEAQKFPPLVSDGSRIYFQEREPGGWKIGQVSVAGGEVAPFPSPLENVSVLDVSPNRSELLVSPAVGSELEAPLWVLPFPAGSARRLGNLRGADASWSPDGKTIVYGKARELFMAKADGSDSRKLASLQGIVRCPRWSADQRVVRLTVYDVSTGLDSLWEISADGTNPHPLFPHRYDMPDQCCGIWTRDGKYFLFQATRDGVTSIWALRESRSLFRAGRPEPVQLTTGPMNFLAPSANLDGKRLLVIGEQRRGELMHYDANARQFVTYLAGISAEGLDFSRDGQWVAYVTYPEGALWRSRVDGSSRLQLSDPLMRAALPHWSSDGKRIAFIGSKPGGAWKVHIVSNEGGTPEAVIPGESSEWNPSWEPSGNSLVFGEPLFAPNPTLHVLDLETRRVSSLPGSQGLFSPQWSPNRRFIAALTKDSRKLLLFDLATEKWKELVSSQLVSYPAWSRNGKYIYFCNPMGNVVRFYRVGVENLKLEDVASVNLPRGLASGMFGSWTGLAPDDSPLLVRDTSIQEIYALDLQLP